MLDIHCGNVLARARSPILVTYTGSHAQVRKRERGLGAPPPEKFMLTAPLRLLENTFSASSYIPGFFRKLTAAQKYIVCLKVISGTLNLKCLCKSIKDSTKARST